MSNPNVFRAATVILVGLFSPIGMSVATEQAACAARLEVVPIRLEVPAVHGQLVESKAFRIAIRNVGSQMLLLVQPGDGSESGLRTPSVSWSVQDSNGPVSQNLGRRTDNGINHLQPGEVFGLAPGESRDLSKWIPPVAFSSPGILRITLHYLNDPHLKWTGHPFGKHDSATMDLVRQSTPCDLVSAPVQILPTSVDAAVLPAK
jgi:hypothetical protein